ncbi:MAG: EFR1 family ferrodoxin [Candidatus Methanomethylophilaceae archaeon]
MIFCFSGTGNCLQVAKSLGKMRGDQIISISDSINNGKTDFDIADGEMVGIICPVYFYGLPLPVEKFIKNMSFNGKKPSIFLILTFGTFTGNTGKQASKLIAKRGFSLDKIFSVPMPENYIPLLKVPDKEKQEYLIEAAEYRIVVIANQLDNNEKKDYDDHKGRFPTIVSFFSRPLYTYGRKTKKFHITSKCNGCGKCSEICPEDAIKIVDNKPIWMKKECYKCLACINRCPTKAIEFGRNTINKERYVNPKIKF